MEGKISKADEVDIKSWNIKLVGGILVGILLIIAVIIGCICIKKKKGVTHGNAEVTADYTLDTFMNGNQSTIPYVGEPSDNATKESDRIMTYENDESCGYVPK